MSVRKASCLLAAGWMAVVLLGGCKPSEGPMVEGIAGLKNYDWELPPGGFALRKLSVEEYPDFTAAFGDTAGLREAIQRSLNYLSKASSRRYFPFGASPTDRITHEQEVATLSTFLKMLDGGLTSSQLNAAVQEKFDVYQSIGCDEKGTVLFTGYYTPIFDASPKSTERFRYPLHKQPPDLVKGPEGEILGRKTAAGTVPYPSRREIDQSNMLAGLEFYWVADPFEAFIIHVQGSARLRMADGKLITIGYAGSNGHNYVSVGKTLVAEGKLEVSQLSLRGLIDYFKAHPDEVQPYTWKNPRFVFFQELKDDSPRGSLNEAVTKLRTVATDKTIFPRASLTFISTQLPRRTGGGIEFLPYTGFTLDQDTGNAIRAPGRCDVYMGIGDESGELAGRMSKEGGLFYIFLRPQFVSGSPAGPMPAAPVPPAPVPPAGSTPTY